MSGMFFETQRTFVIRVKHCIKSQIFDWLLTLYLLALFAQSVKVLLRFVLTIRFLVFVVTF